MVANQWTIALRLRVSLSHSLEYCLRFFLVHGTTEHLLYDFNDMDTEISFIYLFFSGKVAQIRKKQNKKILRIPVFWK